MLFGFLFDMSFNNGCPLNQMPMCKTILIKINLIKIHFKKVYKSSPVTQMVKNLHTMRETQV